MSNSLVGGHGFLPPPCKFEYFKVHIEFGLFDTSCVRVLGRFKAACTCKGEAMRFILNPNIMCLSFRRVDGLTKINLIKF